MDCKVRSSSFISCLLAPLTAYLSAIRAARPQDCVLSLFSPRSAGLFPADSRAKGALPFPADAALLAAQNSFGSVFHWMPVRNTKKIAANTCRRRASVELLRCFPYLVR
jgi:hypothetical protein